MSSSADLPLPGITQAWNGKAAVEFWRAYFEECLDDPFLNGTGPYREPHSNWRPTFDYLMRSDVVTRVFEKAMDRLEREREQGRPAA